MKVEARQLRFVPVLPWFGRRAVRFVGKQNTIQLLETALVIEGQRKTIAYWIVDLLFQQALSEWTTVTVPYSRIVRCRFSRRWVMRSLLILFWILPLVAAFILTIPWVLESDDMSSWSVPLLLFGLITLTTYLLIRLLPARYDLLYRRADGGLALTRFRIRRRAVRQAFEERLEANRRAATRRPEGAAA